MTYHFFDVVLDTYEDRAAERKAEALLDAASRDPAEKWRFVDRCFGDDVPTPPTDCASALGKFEETPRQTKRDGGAALRLRRALPGGRGRRGLLSRRGPGRPGASGRRF